MKAEKENEYTSESVYADNFNKKFDGFITGYSQITMMDERRNMKNFFDLIEAHIMDRIMKERIKYNAKD